MKLQVQKKVDHIVGLLLLCLPAEDLRRSATAGESS